MIERAKRAACGVWNVIKQTWRGVTVGGVLGFVLGAIVSAPLSDFGHWAWTNAYAWMCPQQPTPNTISFNAVDGCFQGDLHRISEVFLPDGIVLANGADNLTICDPQELTALKADMPKALHNKVPGCLAWDSIGSGTLSLIRNSPAVCMIPGTSRLVCDAESAREQYSEAAASYKGAVALCPYDILKKFGFAS